MSSSMCWSLAYGSMAWDYSMAWDVLGTGSTGFYDVRYFLGLRVGDISRVTVWRYFLGLRIGDIYV